MGSRPRTLALAAALLALAACRTELYTPSAPDDEPTPVEGFDYVNAQPWWPAFRVIGEDGERVERYHVDIENGVYYDRFQSPWTSRADRMGVWSWEDFPRPMHPPLDVRVRRDTDEFSREFFDLVPVPGDTLVLDLSDPEHALHVDFEVPTDWGLVEAEVRARGPRAINAAGWDQAFLATEDQQLRDGHGREFRFGLSPGFDDVDRVSLEWTWDHGDWSSRAEFVRRRIGLPTEPLDVRLALQPRRFWIQLQRGGRAIPSAQVIVTTTFSDGPLAASDSVDAFVRSWGRHAGRPVSVWSIGASVDVNVAPSGGSPRWFLPHTLTASISEGDTVTIDLGAFELAVEVVDDAGTPIVDAPVSVEDVSAGGSTNRAWQDTDLDGFARFVVDEGIHDIEVSNDRGVGVFSTRVRVNDDTAVRAVVP